MPTAPRMTMATQYVLRALLADPSTEVYGSEIGEAAGLMSGTVHPILARLEAAGWVESRWEEVDPQVAGRPARRYYSLSSTRSPRNTSPVTPPERSPRRGRSVRPCSRGGT